MAWIRLGGCCVVYSPILRSRRSKILGFRSLDYQIQEDTRLAILLVKYRSLSYLDYTPLGAQKSCSVYSCDPDMGRDSWFDKHSMNMERAKMKICAVVCTVLIKIRRITALKLCYSSAQLPAISQKIKKNVTRELCLNVIIPFYIIDGYLGARPPCPPPPPRCDGTDSGSYLLAHLQLWINNSSKSCSKTA